MAQLFLFSYSSSRKKEGYNYQACLVLFHVVLFTQFDLARENNSGLPSKAAFTIVILIQTLREIFFLVSRLPETDLSCPV